MIHLTKSYSASIFALDTMWCGRRVGLNNSTEKVNQVTCERCLEKVMDLGRVASERSFDLFVNKVVEPTRAMVRAKVRGRTSSATCAKPRSGVDSSGRPDKRPRKE